MKAVNTFFAFIRKEFYHILRDKRSLLILLGMPVVQIILFGFTLSTEIKNIKIAVVAPVQDEMIRQIIERINASDYFTVTGLFTNDEIDRVIRTEKADFAVVFSPFFADRIFSKEGSQIQLIADATDTNTARAVVMYSSSIIRDFLADKTAEVSALGIKPSIRMLYNPQMRSAYSFVPGLMGLIMILICAMMTSISIVREKEIGTMEVLLVSPVKPIYIILSKMIPYFAISCISFASILLLSVFLLGVPLQGSFISLCLLSLLYIIVALSLGLFTSTIANSQVTAMLFSGMVLMMPCIFLSGMVFPVESMPILLQYASCIIPARWYIAGVKKLMIEGLSIGFVSGEFIILGIMAVVLMTVSLKKFKNRLQ
ncbi:MAG: ABC transporter permease [Tannerella sp.]|jgi:ABC-2 type transport system permease protein|nr:ABC transporter permease [Tannerella sp.]